MNDRSSTDDDTIGDDDEDGVDVVDVVDVVVAELSALPETSPSDNRGDSVDDGNDDRGESIV